MRKLILVMASAVTLLAGFMVAAPATNAASNSDVSFVQGLIKGQFGSYQAFDVSRVPALPVCVAGVPDNFRMTVTENVGNPTGSPYSGSSRGLVPLGTGYLMLFQSGDANYPWGIRYYNKAGQEQRWDGTAWITSGTAGWDTALPFSSGGNLVAANEHGFLHISKETGVDWSGGWGTYFSITTPRVPSESVSYSPDPEMNDCTTYKTPNWNGTSTDENGPVLKLTTSRTIYVPDHPLGPPTDNATLKWMGPNAGEIEGLVKPDVFNYNWGVATAGTSSLTLRLYPTNPAATMHVNGDLYRSGQLVKNIAVAPGNPTTLTVDVTSVDETVTKTYTIKLTAYPTNVAPQVRGLNPTSATNRGGTMLTITGVGFTYAKGVVFSPSTNVYDSRAVTVAKTPENIKNGTFKIVTDREIQVKIPAVPRGDGTFWTGKYNVLIDTPFGNSGYDERGVLTYKEPDKPLTVLQWAKQLISPGLTKLLGLPIKMASLSVPKITVKPFWRFGRSVPKGDITPTYKVITKKDGVYLLLNTTKPIKVVVTITSDGNETYAPYQKHKTFKN